MARSVRRTTQRFRTLGKTGIKQSLFCWIEEEKKGGFIIHSGGFLSHMDAIFMVPYLFLWSFPKSWDPQSSRKISPSGPPISCDLMEKYVTKIGALGNILAWWKLWNSFDYYYIYIYIKTSLKNSWKTTVKNSLNNGRFLNHQYRLNLLSIY